MKANTLLSVFTPKDTKFFPLLKETASTMVRAAILLQELFDCSDEEQKKELYKAIKVEEVKGDKVTGSILKALNATFITPFDREDINALTDSMDDVIDVIYRVSHKVQLYSPEKLPECTTILADIIHKGSLEIRDSIDGLENLKKTNIGFRRHYKEIKRLEEEADAIYEDGIMELFHKETNPTELIKLKEIIQELEKGANKINNTGKVLKTIFVKYA